MGRPTKYTPGIASLIADRMGDGETLMAICAEDGMPSRHSVYRWLEVVPEFRDVYARARAKQCDTLAEEALEVARNAKSEDAAAVRNRLDSIKWFTSKVAPKKYGDSQTVRHAGHDGGELTVNLTSAQKLQRVANLTKKLGVERAAQDVPFEEVPRAARDG